MKAILLEDEYLLNSNIKEFLEFKGVLIETYLDGGELLDNCDLKADIAVLDIETPGATGFEVIEWVKQVNENMPVLFMTAYTDIESIKKAYSLGCSDYLKKPFDLDELWLRMQQLLDNSAYTKVSLSVDIVFDLEKEQLYNLDRMVKLTKIQGKILKLFIENKNALVSYELLITEVWDDFFIKTNTIASHVKEIRKFLPESMIESVRAEGYRLHLH